MRKLFITEADSDYVQFGKMRIPKDMSGSGYGTDFRAAARMGQQRYDAEKQAEAERREKDRLIAAGKPLYDKFMKAYNSSSQSGTLPADDDVFSEVVTDILVPDRGMCDTQAGELVRAINRLIYRYWNDGDIFCEDYGLETCASDAAFLIDTSTPEIADALEDVMAYSDKTHLTSKFDSIYANYREVLNGVYNAIMEYLADSPELFATKPVGDSREYAEDSATVEDIIEYGHRWVFEPDQYVPDEYDVDYRDIADFFEDLLFTTGVDGRVDTSYQICSIENITHEECEELYSAFDSAWYDFLEEHPAEEYYDDEDEDEEDEDF